MKTLHKILVVDDEPNIVMTLEYFLRRKGFEVFIARNGQEALTAIAEQHPDLVLLDIMMPDVDGYEICEEVRRQPEYAGMRIVFVSARSRQEDIERGYAVGADLYVQKPFSNRDLLQNIQTLLSRS